MAKKRAVIITTIGLLLCVLMPFIVVKARQGLENRTRIEGVMNFNENVERVRDALAEQGYDMEAVREEKIIPMSWSDKEGHTITFYSYYFRNMECSDDPPAIHEIFDPSTAESSSECAVNELDATLYQKGAFSYLWWSPADGVTLIIEYEPAFVDDAEILKMAESVEHIPSNGG